MKNTKKIIILLLIIILLSIFMYKYNYVSVICRDIVYFSKSFFYFPNTKKNFSIIQQNKYKILFITIEDRDCKFIQLHHKNITMYAEKWGYNYQHIDKIDKNFNVYLYKLFVVQKNLQQHNYDYIVWLDSDTIINNFDIDIENIINEYNNHIIIGWDKSKYYPTHILNAGVFIIKNSCIGKQFIDDCIFIINNRKKDCVDKNMKLNGLWTGICYEQGIMNELIWTKYKKNTTTLPQNIVYNGRKCKSEPFILHLYGSSEKKRASCFSTIYK